ncbi:MAG: hypothetical protein QW701_07035 [Candidatus Nezhaarchaeales archaeon]
MVSVFFAVSWSREDDDRCDERRGLLTAALIDGLYECEPNLDFTDKLLDMLESAGFHVDIYRRDNVTVDLLMNLEGYKLLVLRVHSAMHSDGWLYVFSGEHYREEKYVKEQLAGAVKKGYTFNGVEKPYFALNIAFLGGNRAGALEGSTVILMGCNGSGDPYSVSRLLEKGVEALFAWSGYVDLRHSDKATLILVEALYGEGLSPREAAEKVQREAGPDPIYGSILRCFTKNWHG